MKLTQRQMALLLACIVSPDGARWRDLKEAHESLVGYSVCHMALGTQICRLGGSPGTTRAETRSVIPLINRTGKRGSYRYHITSLGLETFQAYVPKDVDWRPNETMPEDYYV